MNTQDVFNIFLLISAINGFLFSILILFDKNGKEKSIVYINLFMLSISLNNMQFWVYAKGVFTDYFFLYYIHIPWHFLSAPFFYMFFVHYVRIANKSKKILKFIIPLFITIIVARIFFTFSHSNESNTTVIYYAFESYSLFEEMISFFFSLSIFGYTYFILKRKREKFSKILYFDNLRWIHTFFKIGFSIYAFWVIALLIKVSLDFNDSTYSHYPMRIGTTVLIYWAGYQAFIRLRLLKERKKLRMQLNYKDSEKEEWTHLKPLKISEFDAIHSQIIQQKLFATSNLTLEILANQLHITPIRLSSIIRSQTEKTFNDYINGCRIALSKKLLTDSAYKNFTIISIGLESGFNSKSSFYRAFKKETGKTPLEFKEQSYH